MSNCCSMCSMCSLWQRVTQHYTAPVATMRTGKEHPSLLRHSRDTVRCRHADGLWISLCAQQEYDDAEEEGLPAAERLARQRRGLNKRLGLGGQMDALLDTADLVKDEDLVGSGGGGGGASKPIKNPKQHAPSELLSETAAPEPADAAGA